MTPVTRAAIVTLALHVGIASPVLAGSTTAACAEIDNALSVCGERWHALPLQMPDGISVWTDGEIVGKVILQTSPLAEQLTDVDVLNRTLASVAATLPKGAKMTVEAGNARMFGADLHATLSYILQRTDGAFHFRHTVLVSGPRIVQVMTAAPEAQADMHHDTFLTALDFTDNGTAL